MLLASAFTKDESAPWLAVELMAGRTKPPNAPEHSDMDDKWTIELSGPSSGDYWI